MKNEIHRVFFFKKWNNQIEKDVLEIILCFTSACYIYIYIYINDMLSKNFQNDQFNHIIEILEKFQYLMNSIFQLYAYTRIIK